MWPTTGRSPSFHDLAVLCVIKKLLNIIFTIFFLPQEVTNSHE
ncbi:hypothetical protein Ahy_A05g024195 isoform B [Arachis hypogaea]|uniref:Uncharacterized protein n=1 Tax=Arachis hypogaea TaxID=3818 RepID=A0A445D607_ARAHY|nr:hypothetical protein Ahy_A05g024195 isoform B [Arachis hypogaea]